MHWLTTPLAATSLQSGGAVADPNAATLPKLPFKEQVSVNPLAYGIANYPVFEQVKGYAKLTAGTLTGNQREKDLGQAKLDGELDK